MQQKHLYSLKNNSTTLKILKLRLPFFILLHLLFGLAAIGQVSGDYRSTNTGAAVSPYYWNLKTSWEYYNGVTWIPATNYPGEISGTGPVLIRTGDVVNIGTSGITTKSMGILTISGSLVLTGINTGTNGTDFFFDTQTIIVTPLLGTIIFNNKVNLKLPTTATLQVKLELTANPDYYGLVGDCNHNQDIFIGTNVYAYCNGGGSTELTFLQVMTEGGTPNAIATSNSPVCQGGPINLFGSYSGVQGATATYSWSIVNPLGVITTMTTQNPTISTTVLGTYAITLTYSATYNGNTYFNSEIIAVLVNALPILTIPPINQLDCEGSVVSFNVVAIGVGLTYVWQRKLPTDTSFSNIPAETNVSYPTPDKIRLQNVGSSLFPNGAQFQVVVSNSNGCSVTSAATTLSVNEIIDILPKATTVTQCYGTNYSYMVSTSYPANVVSYQWKSSVVSGVWNDVVNGTHFSGATTATLNIINGTPAESGEYRVYITFHSSGADCNVTSASRTRALTFLPTLLTPDAVATQPNCSIATGTIMVAIQNATDTYSFDNGLSDQASNIKSGLAFGNYNVVIKNKGGCVSAAVSKGINAQPATPVKPILSLTTSATCANPLGSFTINNYNAGHTYAVTPNIGFAITGNTATVPPGNYTLIATLGTCSSAPSSEVAISTLETNTWSNGVWSMGTEPTSNQNIIFDDHFSSTDNVTGCTCQVNSAKNVTINPAHTLRVTNAVTVLGTGTLTFKSDQSTNPSNSGSLVQENNVTNLGNITYERITNTVVLSTDYTYWSSPVAAYTLGGVSQNKTRLDKYYSYEPTATGEDWKQESAATVMAPGKGYIIRGPEPPTAVSLYLATFTGVPNNGFYSTTPLYANKYCLLGNPYPSAMSADAFLIANAGVLDGTLYFWTHNTEIQLATNITDGSAGTGTLAYTSNDYASYNITGGVGITDRAKNLGGNSYIPSGKIAAGQGFFGSTKTSLSASAIVFTNAMRVAGTSGNNSQFFKTSSPKAKTDEVIEKHRIWLNLTNSQGAFKQTLVGYITGATNDYDSLFDGESMDGNPFVDFYSLNQDRNLVIQGRALPFEANDLVPLGYKSTIEGSFTIKIDQADGLFLNQAVYLEDKFSNTIFDLKTGSYTFTTAKGIFNDRFVLRYTDKTLGTADVEKPEGQVLVSIQNEQLKINSFAQTIDQVTVYDLSGKQRYQKRKVNSNEVLLATLVPSHQMVLVKTVLQNGKSSTIKVLY